MTAWRSEPLSEAHDLTGFDCGVESLTRWLVDQARRAHRSGTARTYVWTAPDNQVVAYYSIAPTRLLREEVSGGQAGGVSVVPAYLLARLALDASLHGQGLGGELLLDALDVLVDAADRAGGRLIVVDAVDENAVGFYRRYGFIPIKGDLRRLVVKVETVRQALDKPDPKDLPGGVQTVWMWLDAVRAEAPSPLLWVLLDDAVRLALAQGWIMHQADTDPDITRRDRDDLAYALASRDIQHPLAAPMLADLHQHWQQVYALILGGHGVVNQVNTVAPDMEAVVLTGPEHVGRFESGAHILAHTFITRLVGDTWIIAATARRLPQPGWPPTERDVSAFSMPDELTQPESGPSRFALDWLHAVARDDIEAVWPAMAANFRLSMAQMWITNNPQALQDPSVTGSSRDDLARVLSAKMPEHELFVHLARVSLRDIRNSFSNIDPARLGPGARPRPIGPDLELVRLFYLPDLHQDDAGTYSFLPGATARNASVLVHRQEAGWAVAGVGHHLIHPGWPPTFEQVADTED